MNNYSTVFYYFFWLLPFITLDISIVCGLVLSARLFLFSKRKDRKDEKSA